VPDAVRRSPTGPRGVSVPRAPRVPRRRPGARARGRGHLGRPRASRGADRRERTQRLVGGLVPCRRPHRTPGSGQVPQPAAGRLLDEAVQQVCREDGDEQQLRQQQRAESRAVGERGDVVHDRAPDLEQAHVDEVEGVGDPAAVDHGRPGEEGRRPGGGEGQRTDQHGDEHDQDPVVVGGRDALRAPRRPHDHQRGVDQAPPDDHRRDPLRVRRPRDAPDGQAGEHAGEEAAGDAAESHPVVAGGARPVAEVGEGHHRQHGEHPGDGGREVPAAPRDEDQEGERDVGEPLGADRPAGADVRRPEDARSVPDLHHEQLVEEVQRVERGLDPLVGDHPVGEEHGLRDQPQPEGARDERVQGPDAGDAGPQEPADRTHVQPPAQGVGVGVREDEAAQHEEEVDAEPAGSDDRPEGLVEADEGGVVPPGEVVDDHPDRSHDPQTRQRADLTARNGGRRRASDRGCTHEHRP
jgi:hypothetical protein